MKANLEGEIEHRDEQIDTLRAEVADAKKKRRTVEGLTKKQDDEIEELEQQIDQLKSGEAFKDLQDELVTLNDRITELEDENKQLRKGSNKDVRQEQAEDVNNAIKRFMKDVIFRNMKFAEKGEELDGVTKRVWVGIKDRKKLDQGPNALDEEQFVRIYSSAVQKEFSDRRQYSQSRGFDAVKGTLIFVSLHQIGTSNTKCCLV